MLPGSDRANGTKVCRQRGFDSAQRGVRDRCCFRTRGGAEGSQPPAALAMVQMRLMLVTPGGAAGIQQKNIDDLAATHRIPPAAWSNSRSRSYARWAFCLTAPTVEEVARATSSSVNPPTFNIVITSRC